MKRITHHFVLRGFLLAGLPFYIPNLSAQTQGTPTTSAEEGATAPIKSEESEEVFELTPFEVTSDGNIGYMATNTLAGSRLRTDLRDLGSSISVVTKELLEDTGSTDANDILVYTTGTESSGPGGNFSGADTSAGFTDDRSIRVSPQNGTRVRGLTRADLMRDYFLTLIPMDSYNTERIDIQRGANAILFGLGSPAGIINNTVSQPNMSKNINEVKLGIGRWGTIRGEADFDRMITDTFGLRVIALHEDEQFRQDPAYARQNRLFATAKWTPQLIKNGSTSIKVNFETGDMDSNRPRINPPRDLMSFWFDPNAMNKQVWSPAFGVRPYGASSYPAPGDSDFVQDGGRWSNTYTTNNMGRWYATVAAIFNDETSSLQGGNGLEEMLMRDGEGYGGTAGLLDVSRATADANHLYNVQAGRNLSGFWIDQEMTDRSIFDYYNKLLEGPNKHEWRNFDAVNLTLAQTFFNDMMGIEVAYDKQESDWGDYGSLAYNSYGIQIDFNEHLADGRTNPNFGRPYIASDGVDGGETFAEYETLRATAFLNLDVRDFFEKDSLLTRILGRHTFTGNYNKITQDRDNRLFNVFSAGPEIVNYDSVMGGSLDNSGGKGYFAAIHYLGDPIDHLDSPSGAHIPNISAYQFPASSGTAFLYDDVTANDFVSAQMSVLNFMDDRDLLVRQAALSKQEIESTTFIWQGWFLEGHVVALAAWRHDQSKYWLNNSPERNDFNNMLVSSGPGYQLPSDPQSVVEGGTPSYGLVVHLPEIINRYLPLGTQVSLFYNESSNFQPDSTRVDVYNEPLPSPSGETKDYGFTLSMLEEKLVLRVNRYESSIKNSSVSSIVHWHAGNQQIRAINGFQAPSNSADIINKWFGYEHPLGDAADADGDGIWDTGAYEAGNLNALPRKPNGAFENLSWGGSYAADFGDGTYAGQNAQTVRQNWLGTQPDDLWIARMDPRIVEGWGWERTGPYRWQTDTPPGMASIGDVVSKGTEVELTYNPATNWRITMNVVKQTVTNTNLAGDLDDFIAAGRAVWEDGNGNAPPTKPSEQDGFADIAYFGGYNWLHGPTMSQYITIPYLKATNLIGASNPEVRKWRVNLITNYRFMDGPLKNISIGGAIRWQDKVAIGYPVIEDPEVGLIYDVNHPYYGPEDTQFDLWIGYYKQIFKKKVIWNIRLNVRDIFGSDELIPVKAQPDGRIGSYRMPNPNVWSITSSFKF